MLHEISLRTMENGVELTVSHDAAELLLDRGYDPKYGARPLRRAIQKMVEDTLSNMILEGDIKSGDKVSVTTENGELKFSNK